MKINIYATCLALLLGMGISGSGYAATITTVGSFFDTDVGSTDIWKATTDSLDNSNPTTETNWINSVLGTQFTGNNIKTENVDVYSTDGTNIFAFQLHSDPGYFIIKNSTFWAIFQNVAKLDWGVFDSTTLPNDMNVGAGHLTISHISEYGEGEDGGGPECAPGQCPPPLPEPNVIALFGIGLLGLGMQLKSRYGKL